MNDTRLKAIDGKPKIKAPRDKKE